MHYLLLDRHVGLHNVACFVETSVQGQQTYQATKGT